MMRGWIPTKFVSKQGAIATLIFMEFWIILHLFANS